MAGLFRRRGERLSGAVVDLLHASAETPGMPPWAGFEDLGDTGDGSAAEADFTPSYSSEIDPLHTDLAQAEAIGRDTAEDALPALDQTAIPADTHAPGSDPDLWLYRDRTVALLRRYMRLSIEVGRMPSLLGREFFRTRVTSYGSSTFEDSVIFVHDVERSLEELNEFEKKLIAKIVLQQFSKEEAGRLLGCGYRTVERLFPEALDRVSQIFLKRGILTGLPGTKCEVPKSCQGGKIGRFLASD
jgi:DNA-directed RNA polymerase specialized sigma24 family protein